MSEIEGFEKKANAGDVEAMFQLGVAYAFGRGAELNLEKALHWLNKAADCGHKDAASVMKELHIKGRKSVTERLCLWFFNHIDILPTFSVIGALLFGVFVHFVMISSAFIVKTAEMMEYIHDHSFWFVCELFSSPDFWLTYALSFPGLIIIVLLPYLMAFVSKNYDKCKVLFQKLSENFVFIFISIAIRILCYFSNSDIGLGLCWIFFLFELGIMIRIILLVRKLCRMG